MKFLVIESCHGSCIVSLQPWTNFSWAHMSHVEINLIHAPWIWSEGPKDPKKKRQTVMINKSTLVHEMAWCLHVSLTRIFMTLIMKKCIWKLSFLKWITIPWANEFFRSSFINTLRPRQNGRHFADDTLRCIFLNENVWILTKISLKIVLRVR